MFTRIILGISLLFVIGTEVRAQSGDIVLSQIKSSIMSADAVGLTEQTVNTVEIGLFGIGRYYSKGQATVLLKSFFRDYPPEDFVITGSTQTPGAWFVEGEYEVQETKEPLRFHIRLRISEGSWKIRELLVEEVDE